MGGLAFEQEVLVWNALSNADSIMRYGFKYASKPSLPVINCSTSFCMILTGLRASS